MLLMNKNLAQGFTLLEVLLSIIIFTLISLTVYQAITATVKGNSVINKKLREINKLQTAINMIEDHVSHTVVFPKIQKNSQHHNGLQVGKFLLKSDDYGIYFLCDIHSGISYHIQPMPIGYRLKNGRLEKLLYDLSSDELKVSKILDGVTAFVIRVYYEGKWLTQWNESAILPHGIEIIIKLENIGTIRKIIPLLNENFQPEMNR